MTDWIKCNRMKDNYLPWDTKHLHVVSHWEITLCLQCSSVVQFQILWNWMLFYNTMKLFPKMHPATSCKSTGVWQMMVKKKEIENYMLLSSVNGTPLCVPLQLTSEKKFSFLHISSWQVNERICWFERTYVQHHSSLWLGTSLPTLMPFFVLPIWRWQMSLCHFVRWDTKSTGTCTVFMELPL